MKRIPLAARSLVRRFESVKRELVKNYRWETRDETLPDNRFQFFAAQFIYTGESLL